MLQCEKEKGNSHDLYALAMKKGIQLLAMCLALAISTLCSLFLSRGRIITCTVTGIIKHSDDLPQGGLEVPCQLTFRGDQPAIDKVKKLLCDKPKDQLKPEQPKDKPQKAIEEIVAKAK